AMPGQKSVVKTCSTSCPFQGASTCSTSWPSSARSWAASSTAFSPAGSSGASIGGSVGRPIRRRPGSPPPPARARARGGGGRRPLAPPELVAGEQVEQLRRLRHRAGEYAILDQEVGSHPRAARIPPRPGLSPHLP